MTTRSVCPRSRAVFWFCRFLSGVYVCVHRQRATTAVSLVTSSVTVPTRACRRPTVVLATAAERQGTSRVTALTSRWTTASATTAALSATSRGIVRRAVAVERRQRHRHTMTAPRATSRWTCHYDVIQQAILTCAQKLAPCYPAEPKNKRRM